MSQSRSLALRTFTFTIHSNHNLVPRPHPAFHHFQLFAHGESFETRLHRSFCLVIKNLANTTNTNNYHCKVATDTDQPNWDKYKRIGYISKQKRRYIYSGDLRPGSSTFIMFFDLTHSCCWT